MILTLFIVFSAVSLILIALGLILSEHSELALIGFVFLFLLSFTVMGNNLTYSTGYTQNETYINENLTSTTTLYLYENYDDTTSLFNTHRFGYFLALGSFIGFVGVLMNLTGFNPLRRRE